MKHLAKSLLLFLGCLHLCGGHLGVWQCVAWAKMLVTYSQEKGLAAGVKETFDGEHPCPMCLAIEQQRLHEQERKQGNDQAPVQETSGLAKYLVPPERVAVPDVPEAPQAAVVWVAPSLVAAHRPVAPPVPPPRFAVKISVLS